MHKRSRKTDKNNDMLTLSRAEKVEIDLGNINEIEPKNNN